MTDTAPPAPSSTAGPAAALRVRVEGALAVATIAGTGEGNALGGDFWPALHRFLEDAARRDDVRCLALTGAGDTFSVGMDLRWYVVRLRRALRGGDTSFMDDDVLRLRRAVSAVAACPKPVVALVDGACVGAALELVSACDIRYATGSAHFALPEAELGVVADLGGLQRLPLLIGQGHLREMAFTGRAVPAARAEQIGLVNDVFPTAAAMHDAARGLAEEIGRHPAHVMDGIKQVLDGAHEEAVRRGLDRAARWNSLHTGADGLCEAMAARLRRTT